MDMQCLSEHAGLVVLIGYANLPARCVSPSCLPHFSPSRHNTLIPICILHIKCVHVLKISVVRYENKIPGRHYDVRSHSSDPRYISYNTDTLHSKSSSHDSTGSRSSGHGSMEGHQSEVHASRSENNLSSEGFGVGEDHSRQAYKENGEGNLIFMQST